MHCRERDGLPQPLNPNPYTLHPKPYTQHPQPYTLNPKPHTLHSKPSTHGLAHAIHRRERDGLSYTLNGNSSNRPKLFQPINSTGPEALAGRESLVGVGVGARHTPPRAGRVALNPRP